LDAADVAATQVAAVRDDPAARVALNRALYEHATAAGPRRLPYRRAAMSFMRWEIQRGLLDPPGAQRPGSPWWRALNERLLRDGCEAAARANGRGGAPSSPSVMPWLRFGARPTAGSWYRAHNGSIAAAYLDHRELAKREGRGERFFMNVVLLRVFYAHALVAAPRLALGPLAPLSRALGDPRLGMAGIFLSLQRVLPDRYPIADDVESYVRQENGFGRLLDYAVIQPRLQRLYEWSAATLELPAVADLIADGNPTYAWPAADRDVWAQPRLPPLGRVMAAATRVSGPAREAVR
jgi:hypothetical protein